MHEVELSAGTIRYRERGSGQPLVFVHGLLVDGSLWRKVVPPLEDRFRCIVPDWPLGSHTVPMRADADLSPRGVAHMVAELLERLALEDVTVVANDTGGAIAQLLVVDRPERVGRLVLTPCDAFENFLPPVFRPLQYFGSIPGALAMSLNALRLRPLRRLPLALGWLAKRPVPDEVADAWLRPARVDRDVRRDVLHFLRSIDSADTLAAAERLHEFDRPVLLAWATEDRAFPVDHARRLAAIFPNAVVAEIPDSYTFVPEDAPEELARLVTGFASR